MPTLRAVQRAAAFTFCIVLAGCMAPPASGADDGWIDDRQCTTCHAELARSFREVGMARSFGAPTTMESIEVFGTASRFHHPASKRWYQMDRRGDHLVFRRWQLDDRGQRIHEIELTVDWILGSGHTSRSYLVRQPGGELYHLPISWYTQEGRWAMAPGYDKARHMGLDRRIERECMFCHNAYPQASEGAATTSPLDDAAFAPAHFPASLPHGIGCQRCHGPGAAHVDAAIVGAGAETIRSTIVQPARLEPQLRDDVCRQCHLQPSVALLPVRRFGRGTYSFVAGQPITDYQVYVDPEEEGSPRDERFEINHHAYRLEQSPCWTESAVGALSCLSCHDPHRKVPPPERAAHYRDACRACHPPDACTAPVDQQEPAEMTETADAADCVSCHMPRRRTRDVVHVVMTDHRIQRPGRWPDALEPREEHEPILTDVDFLYPTRTPDEPIAGVVRTLAALRAGSGADAARHLGRQLQAIEAGAADGHDMPTELHHPEPWLALARGLTLAGDAPGASAALDVLAARWPERVVAREFRATVDLLTRRPADAVANLRAVLDAGQGDAVTRYSLGLALWSAGDRKAAEHAFAEAVAARPLMAKGWRWLGRSRALRGDLETAEHDLRQALRVEPSFTPGYVDLADLLMARERPEAARRILRHGRDHAFEPERIAEAWTRLGFDRGTGDDAASTDHDSTHNSS